MPWMPWAVNPTLAGTRAKTGDDERAWAQDGLFNFVFVLRETETVLGVVGFNRDGSEAKELHYWIRSDHAGRGLTTEAASAVIDWGRDQLQLTRVTLWAGRDNHASRRVAEKLGFKHLGPLSWRPAGGLGDFDAESYELVLGA